MTAAIGFAAPASAQDQPPRPEFAIEESGIIIRNDLDPNALPPGGVLDSGINGVGQMTIRGNPATTSMNLCTGTLINPRTVIFAAHCVNSRPAEAYGPNGIPFGAQTAGGTPIAFGFQADNLPAVRQWLGLDGGTAGATNIARALYAVEQVWWDPRSRAPASCTNPNSCFLQADVAIATLETPAFDIPTWAMLFSPLDGPTHVTITGYGNRGRENTPTASLGIDWRRRSAENMLGILGSLNDRNAWIFGTGSAATNNVYLFDFSDPNRNYNPAAGRFDFGLYGSGQALPREGTTAGGDSGGPLIVDQKYDRPVVAGVLSGGSRFFVAQAGHRYGTDSFYQPLFLYWDVIVANNPYVYAGNKGGDGNWEDGSHWVQLMDPSYMIDVGGKLVNGLPDTAAQGVAPGGAKFGQICFLSDCTTLSGTQAAGNGTSVFVPGGPGSTDFVPNNRAADPKNGVRARYYDVTLSAAGSTALNSAVTIDRMTLDGPTRLDVKSGGSLRVLGEYNQIQGWTHVDGRIESGRDLAVITGLLSGSGTVKAPFVTVGAGIVAPGGGDRIGTLSIDGNLILSSGSALFVDVRRGASDLLNVSGTLSLGGINDLGASLVFNKVTDTPAPRHGESRVIVNASDIEGKFRTAATFQGVLRPELTYSDTSITATFRAGSLVTILDGQNATAVAFAKALDQLRSGSYNNLYNLYGAIDWMNGAQLSATLGNLVPRTLGETTSLHDRQSRRLTSLTADRLSLLGTGQASGLTTTGQLAMLGERQPTSASARLGLAPSQGKVALGNGMSGFLDMSASRLRAGYGADVQSNAAEEWHVASGLELPLGSAMIGTAFGLAGSESRPGTDRAELRVQQAAAYGSLPLGGNAYVGAMLSGETMRSESTRLSHDGLAALSLRGDGSANRVTALVETGYRQQLGTLAVTPRAQLAYSRTRLSGFDEQGGETALKLDSLAQQRLEGRVGARFDGRTALGGWTLTPSVQADYVRLIAGGRDGMTVRFAAAPDAPILLPLVNGGKGWAELKGGLTLAKGDVSVGLSGNAALGNAPFADQRGAVDFTVRF